MSMPRSQAQTVPEFPEDVVEPLNEVVSPVLSPSRHNPTSNRMEIDVSSHSGKNIHDPSQNLMFLTNAQPNENKFPTQKPALSVQTNDQSLIETQVPYISSFCWFLTHLID